MNEEDSDDRAYQLVINQEEQVSIWPADREPPIGWKAIAGQGSREECLARVDQLWTDMRPLSVRDRS